MTSSRQMSSDIAMIDGLESIAARFDAILSDVWGVLIDGQRHFPRAADALRHFRAQGGFVVLITNASRPDDEVRRQLLAMGLPQDCFDDLVSAGELTLQEITMRHGQSCYQLGPARDNGLFDAANQRGASVQRVGWQQADYIVCTGLVDERSETPEDYDDLLAKMASRGLEMLCANPDVLVAIGDEMVYCAGALAQRYERLGGRVTMFGKPHAPIYAAAFERLAHLKGAPVNSGRVLTIGDGAATDLAGAGRAGLDCLFITDGVHVEELVRPDGTIDPEGLARLMECVGARPYALAREVFW